MDSEPFTARTQTVKYLCLEPTLRLITLRPVTENIIHPVISPVRLEQRGAEGRGQRSG